MKEAVVEQAIKTYFTGQFAQFFISPQCYTQLHTKHSIQASCFWKRCAFWVAFLVSFYSTGAKKLESLPRIIFNCTSATLCGTITPPTSEQGIYAHKALRHAAHPDCKDVIKNPSDTDTDAVTDTDEDDPVGFHLNWGMHIRNTYNLWQNPSLVKALGVDDPDGASVIIIKGVWQASRPNWNYIGGKYD